MLAGMIEPGKAREFGVSVADLGCLPFEDSELVSSVVVEG
jgi:hypothetical protein